MVKKKVIYDFRQADIQNNGQGAPLTPIFHHILSKKIYQNFNLKFPIGFLNIGGITNVTKVTNDSDNFQNNNKSILRRKSTKNQSFNQGSNDNYLQNENNVRVAKQ